MYLGQTDPEAEMSKRLIIATYYTQRCFETRACACEPSRSKSKPKKPVDCANQFNRRRYILIYLATPSIQSTFTYSARNPMFLFVLQLTRKHRVFLPTLYVVDLTSCPT